MYWATLSRSGWHRANKSGRALPNIIFMPSVNINEVMTDIAKPSQAVFNSQSFRFQINRLGTYFDTVGPGAKMRTMRKVIMIGATTAARTSVDVEMVSWTV